MADNQEFYRLKLVLTMEDRLTRRLQKVNEIASKFEDELKKTQAVAKQFGNSKIAPEIDIKASRANEKLNRINKLLEQVSRKIAKPKIDIDDKTSIKTSSIQRKLGSITNKTWQVTVNLKDEVSSGLGKIKNALSSPISSMGMSAATMGIGGFITDSVNKTMDFSAEISNIKALTGMGAAEIASVRQKALDLGATTQFTSTQAAQGMAELLKAGVDVKEVMGDASQAMLDLAAAGDLDLPEAAEIMSTAMNTFHMKDAIHAADILAGAANASATSVHEMKYSLSAVGNVAAGLGLSFDDTNTALAVFAQNGLKGSDAGTSLKTMLQRLQPTTDTAAEAFQRLGLLEADGGSAFYDTAGKMKSMADVAELLHNSMKDLTLEEQGKLLNDMFGSDAIRGGMILVKEGAAGIRKMNEEMTKFTASDVAKVKWDNAKGDIIRLQSAFENFQIKALAPLEPAIRVVAQAFTDIFSKQENLDAVTTKVSEISQGITDFVSALKADEAFQKMDLGDKVVYVLDRMMEAIDKWASGSGGEQFGKVMTKLAEIGMRAFLAALLGLMKGAFKALLNGNFAGAAGLAFGASLLGGGTLLAGAVKGIKAASGFAWRNSKYSGVYDTAVNIAKENGEGSIKSRISAAKFTFDYSPLAKALPIFEGISKRLPLIGGVMDTIHFATADDKVKTGTEIAGGWAGALAGGKLGAMGGAALGSFIPVVGTGVGAFIGGLGGSIAGYIGGSNIGSSIVDWLRGDSNNESRFNILNTMAQAGSPVGQSGMTMNNGQIQSPSSFDFSTMFGGDDTATQLPMTSTAQMAMPPIDATAMMASIENIKNSAGQQITEAMDVIGQAVENAKNNINNIFSTLFSEESLSQAINSFSEMYSSVSNWCSQIYGEIVNWFSQIPARIEAFCSEAAARAKAGLADLKTSAWNAMPSPIRTGLDYLFTPGHADGGIFDQEHIARFAEGGKPEAIIPLHSSMRSRGLELWQQAGEMLGVNSQLFTNVTNNNFMPALATAGAAGSSASNSDTGSSSAFTFNGMNINIGNNKSDDEIAYMIGRRIVNELRQSFENRG